MKTTQRTHFEQSVRDKARKNEIHHQQTSSNTRTSVAQTRPERTRLRPSPNRSLAGQKNVTSPLASRPQGKKSPPRSLMQTRSGRIIKASAKLKGGLRQKKYDFSKRLKSLRKRHQNVVYALHIINLTSFHQHFNVIASKNVFFTATAIVGLSPAYFFDKTWSEN